MTPRSTSGSSSSPSAVDPVTSQNSAVTTLRVCRAGAATGSSAVQDPQNLNPSGFSAPQRSHTGIAPTRCLGAAKPSGPREPPAGGGRGGLVDPHRGRVSGVGLEGRHPLGGHRRLVLVLGKPLLGLGGCALVTDNAPAGGVVLVDLGE